MSYFIQHRMSYQFSVNLACICQNIKTMIRIFIAILILSTTTQSMAGAGSIEPYFNTGIVHQSNLFLLADDEEAQQIVDSDNIPSDTLFQFTPGIKGDFEHSRQKFLIDLSLTEIIYDKFDEFNFTGGDARIRWDWLYGRKWDGRANYRFSSKQSKFDERLSAGDSSDIHLLSFTANRRLTPRYSILSGISYRTVDYDRRDNLSKDSDWLDLGLRYTSRSDNSLAVFYRYEDGDYPDRGAAELARGLDSGYRDQSLLARLYWQTSAKSLFDIEAGFTDRSQDNFSQNDFDGLIGKAIYGWSPTEAVTLNSYIWRELRDSEDQLTNFVEVDGIGLGFEWKNTAKITSFANLEFEDRDFQSNGLVENALEKKDEYTAAEIGFNYLLKDNLVLTSAYRYEERDSNVRSRNYDNDIWYLYLEYAFE